jgi:hypothetical protein
MKENIARDFKEKGLRINTEVHWPTVSYVSGTLLTQLSKYRAHKKADFLTDILRIICF